MKLDLTRRVVMTHDNTSVSQSKAFFCHLYISKKEKLMPSLNSFREGQWNNSSECLFEPVLCDSINLCISGEGNIETKRKHSFCVKRHSAFICPWWDLGGSLQHEEMIWFSCDLCLMDRDIVLFDSEYWVCCSGGLPYLFQVIAVTYPMGRGNTAP